MYSYLALRTVPSPFSVANNCGRITWYHPRLQLAHTLVQIHGQQCGDNVGRIIFAKLKGHKFATNNVQAMRANCAIMTGSHHGIDSRLTLDYFTPPGADLVERR